MLNASIRGSNVDITQAEDSSYVGHYVTTARVIYKGFIFCLFDHFRNCLFDCGEFKCLP